MFEMLTRLSAVLGRGPEPRAETAPAPAAGEVRVAGADLRQAVAAALRDNADPVETARRVAALIGEALGADAVHGMVPADSGDLDGISVRWPATAPSLSARTVHDILAGESGTPREVPHMRGALAVPVGGDAGSSPGLIYVLRHDRPEWTADERRLLAKVAREIDHAVGRQRLHRRQSRLIRELRALDERKGAFVATVTHELRTPLTSILGYAEMLADGDAGELSPVQRRGVGAILRNARRLHDTVADLLLLDRANGPVGAPAVRVDLYAVIAALHAEFEPLARGRGTALTGEAEQVWVDADARQLERALRNLLDNAVKFTDRGEVRYRLRAEGASAVLTVADTGIGIPEGDLAGLFTPFHRAANAMDQAVQGSGLGLAIVRGIVTEHGGTVTVSSRLGHGSTFTVTLPLAATPRPAA
ncbi:HAMP domain-containing sensor histidine kinase [Actinoplanes sp. NPDC049118]|uniref:sensor histidine kinase n=1 Tax=Actinoplanes sp. NPDC049118 TaxID=3155769 RepID=UPI0033ED8DD5